MFRLTRRLKSICLLLLSIWWMVTALPFSIFFTPNFTNLMANSLSISMRYFLIVLLLLLLLQFEGLQGQQSYVDNKQLDCENNHTTALGYVCNGAATSCRSYLTFRTNPTYNNPATIGYLLGADASEIARINNISDVANIPANTLVIVPLNCSCSSSSSSSSGGFYQHNASYVLKTASETYFSVANNTYEGLSTCQSMIAQNPYNYRNLSVGMKLNIPLRCACPTANQTAAGFKYLLAYLVKWGDSYDYIASTFGVDDLDSIYNANELSPDHLIYPFTPLLIPLKSEPISINTSASPPPPSPPPQSPAVPSGDQSSNSTSHKWVFVGVGIGIAVLLLLTLPVFLVWYSRRYRRRTPSPPPQKSNEDQKLGESADYMAVMPQSSSWSLTSQGSHLRDAIGSLTVYKFEELQKATNFFAEANRIKGSVYKGSFKGDYAAVKEMKGDVSSEINVLKHLNHSNIIRLSGFCVHQGHTYLVYEYAENGSLRDWLHHQHNNNNDNKKSSLFQDSLSTPTTLGWKQRVQIAYDAADALNYLHNYANPPYIHKNLKSSNIFLDANMRAKLANFGLARAVNNAQNDQEEEGGLIMTKHVVGTHGYMAPEYIENGLVTPKLDVFSIGVLILELLSGKEAAPATRDAKEAKEELLSATIQQVLGGENVREKLVDFIDPCLEEEYPLDSAYSMAQLAKNCVSMDLNNRPTMAEVFITLSKILSSSLDWDPSNELENSRSLSHGR